MVSPQVLGVLCLAFGAWLLWSPWAWVIAGGLLVVVPELVALSRRPR